ncbi:MAG: nitroreductase [Acidimicrobiia bacterium]|nr:nitroreductase [Acidimicrobiia bacterium]
METWDAITSRRNVRSYNDQPIPEADLDRILEAGRRTPSAMNRQPWDFVVSTDRAQLAELAKCWQGAGHVAGSAATITLVTPVTEDPRKAGWNAYDLGQVSITMMIAAADLGIGSAHAVVEDRELASSILGLPDGQYAAFFIALGYPADRPLSPINNLNRRPFDEVVHRGGW